MRKTVILAGAPWCFGCHSHGQRRATYAALGMQVQWCGERRCRELIREALGLPPSAPDASEAGVIQRERQRDQEFAERFWDLFSASMYNEPAEPLEWRRIGRDRGADLVVRDLFRVTVRQEAVVRSWLRERHSVWVLA
ncbi:MAG TPA: hypothetical protein VI792_03200 [Candidatus Eisenbacteria bacterium]